MKLIFSYILLIFGIFFLTSCANYKPISYDNDSHKLQNYKKNYSVTILDNYNMLDPEEKNEIISSFIQGIPTNSIVFEKDNKKFQLVIVSMGNFNLPSRERRIEAIELTSKQLSRKLDKIYKKRGHSAVETEDEIINFEISKGSNSRVDSLKGSFTLYPLVKESGQYAFFLILIGSSKQDFKQAKQDYINMYQTLKLSAFTQDERKVD